MTPSVDLVRVQARIAELQAMGTAAAAPLTGPSPSGRFGELLAAQMRATETPPVSAPPPTASPSPPPTVGSPSPGPAGAPGPTGAAAPPAPSSVYDNGRIPLGALDLIGRGDHRLWGPAAVSFRRLLADAERAGVRIGVTDSYRSFDEQVDVARRKGLYSQGGLAAKPGTSQHGWGLAVDLDLDGRAQAWMRANAGRYGFVEDTPREPWHWAYKGI